MFDFRQLNKSSCDIRKNSGKVIFKFAA